MSATAPPPERHADDALREVLGRDLAARIKGPLTKDLLWKLEVLSACGPYPSDPSDADRVSARRAIRAAWETYVGAALALGFFEGREGAALRRRLAGLADPDFRSAMSECLVSWFFAGRLGLKTTPRPPGRGSRILEMLVEHHLGEFKVEVKAPFVTPPDRCWSGDDSDVLRRTLDEANKQFGADSANVLVVVPSLKVSAYAERGQLIRAFYGEEKIVIPIDPMIGAASEPPTNRFFPEGRFFYTGRPGGKPLKPDGGPRFTRIGAIVTVEERLACGPEGYWQDHKVLVAHNPLAVRPIPESIWGAVPQFVPRDGVMRWTDGRR